MPTTTTRSFRRVSIKEWPVSSLAEDRYQRLLSGPDPPSLLLRLVSEAEVAAQAKQIAAQWQEAGDCEGVSDLACHQQRRSHGHRTAPYPCTSNRMILGHPPAPQVHPTAEANSLIVWASTS
jgi:hypothetical protein